MEKEEQLFRALERHIVSKRLTSGFVSQQGEADVDAFVSYSLSVQNRRKSRVGLTLENHLAQIFQQSQIQYSRTGRTENHSKPDFLFPSQTSYQDARFDPSRLLMLGVKSTCKDRWRQVLAEADRIPEKHLLTLEAPISQHQTDEMRMKSLTLVIPKPLQKSFKQEQRGQLMSVLEFIALARERQTEK